MLKKHPKGLMVLFFTEMWERFGFYTLMAILVLYMDKEFKWDDSLKGDYYGIFLGAVYFIPLLGGWIADRFLGQINTIRIGAIIMVFGYVAIALSSANQIPPFFIGLALVAFGTGIFKGNMSVLVGNLYHDKPELKDAGFNIYYMGVNVGATIAPLTATAISYYLNSYNISFWAAAVGMAVSVLIFQIGKKQLYHADNKISAQQNLRSKDHVNNRVISKEEEKQRITTLVILFFIVVFFWVAFYQNGFALTLFAERSTLIVSFLRPETYQFFNPFFILIATPVLLSIFSSLNKKGKEPSTPFKIFLGLIVMGISMVIMIFASLSGGNSDTNIMSPNWLIATYFFVTLSEIMISPMGQSFVSKVAPPRLQGLMMGGWFGATAMGSYGSGLLGKFYSNFPHHQYFMILTSLLAVSAILVILFMKKLKRFSSN